MFSRAVFKLLVYVLVIISCRSFHNQSNLNIRDDLKDLLDIGSLPFHKKLILCSRNILVIYVGNAESLGKVYFRPKARSLFGESLIHKWQEQETKREQAYYEIVKKQGENLVNMLAKGDGCMDPTLQKYLPRSGKLSLVQVIDGPNHTQSSDSEIISHQFAFDANAEEKKWQLSQQKKWIYDQGLIYENHDNKSFEFLLPDAIESILRWAALNFMPDQIIYVFKSHGGRFTSDYKSPLELLQPSDQALNYFTEQKESAFLFDSYGPYGYLAKTEFMTTLWSPATICQHFKDVLFLNEQSCLDKFAQHIAVPTVVNTSEKKASDEAQGRTNDTQGRTNDTQGRTNDTQGRINDTQGRTNDTQGRTNDTQGRTNDTQGLSPTMMESDATYLFDFLTLGESFWEGNTQGVEKGHIVGLVPDKDNILPFQRSQILEDIRPPELLRGEPEAFRYLGTGRTIASILYQQKAVKFLPTTTYNDLVILDTCSSSIVDKNSLPLDAVFSDSDHQQHNFIFFSNPKPLLIDALNYGALTGYQLGLLIDIIKEEFEQARSANIKTISDKLLRPELKLTESRTSENRLYSSYLNCLDSGCNFQHHNDQLYKIEDVVELFERAKKSLDSVWNKKQYDEILLFLRYYDIAAAKLSQLTGDENIKWLGTIPDILFKAVLLKKTNDDQSADQWIRELQNLISFTIKQSELISRNNGPFDKDTFFDGFDFAEIARRRIIVSLKAIQLVQSLVIKEDNVVDKYLVKNIFPRNSLFDLYQQHVRIVDQIIELVNVHRYKGLSFNFISLFLPAHLKFRELLEQGNYQAIKEFIPEYLQQINKY